MPAAPFMFATGIENSTPTILGGAQRMGELAKCGHYDRWQQDLDLVRDLGVTFLRWGPPLYRTHVDRDRLDCGFVDAVLDGIQRRALLPIVDPMRDGNDYYVTNEHLVRADGSTRAAGEVFGYDEITRQYQRALSASEHAGAPDAIAIQCDVGEESRVVQLGAEVLGHSFSIGVIVNNAGLMTFRPIEELSGQDWERVLRVDLMGAFFFTKLRFHHMCPGRR